MLEYTTISVNALGGYTTGWKPLEVMNKYNLVGNSWTSLPRSLANGLRFAAYGNTRTLRIAIAYHTKKIYQYDPSDERVLERTLPFTAARPASDGISLIVSDKNLDCRP